MEQIVINIIDTHNDFLPVEKYTEAGAPLLTYSGGESRFSPLMSSKFSFNILNETAEDGRYLDLLTGDERRFLIEVREVAYFASNVDKDAGVIWRGFLLPDVYSEPYENGSFFVEFTATDGLDVLKTKPFLFYKSGSVIECIAKCLWETGLNQEIYFAPSIENAFYDWKNIQIFEECFTKYNENTDTFQYSSCYTVLESLMKAVGATLLQHNGKWFIVGYSRKGSVLDSFKVYDVYGQFLRTEQHVKKVKKPDFVKGLSVNMVSPYKSVQLNVSYQQDASVVNFNQFIRNETLSSDEFHALGSSISTADPFNKWRKNAAAKVGAVSEDNTEYLRLLTDNGNVTIHDPNEVPTYVIKPPYCVELIKVYGPPHDFEKDYIEIKPDHTIFVSPQVDGKSLKMDVDMGFKSSRRIDEQRYKEDFYSRVFRVDILIGETVVFSTRSESDKYNGGDTKISYEAGALGPEYMWYTFPNTPPAAPNQRLARFRVSPKLKAEVKRKDIKTSAFGKLNIRLYIPRNGDNSFGLGANDYHIDAVAITNLDIKVKAWDNEQYLLSREIRYTTKYETDLEFGDGKNDLYYNLFKINDRTDYKPTLNEIILFNGSYSSDNLYYYFSVPGVIGDYVNSRYYSLKLYSGTKWHYAHLVFGKLSPESGIEFTANKIRISKSRIDEFPTMRGFLNNITKITVGEHVLLPGGSLNSSNTVPREKYIEWKRWGESETNRYLKTYAKIIHECNAIQAVALNGIALSVVSPLDIVQFSFLGEKNFIPTAVQIDFSAGKTRLSLTEAINQNVIDYANT